MKLQILVTFMARFGTAAAGFVIAILLSQFLGADGKGQASLLVLNISFINLFTNVMGGAALVYLAPRYKAFTLLALSYAWVLLAVILAFAGFILFGVPTDSLNIHVFALALLLGWFQSNSSFLLGKKKTHIYNMLAIVQVGLTLIYLLAAFYSDFTRNFTQYIIALYIGYGLSFLASFFFALKETGEFKFSEAGVIFPAFIKLGAYMQLANLAQLLIYRASFYMIEYFRDDSHLGIYSNAIAIAESIWIVSRSISTVQYAEVANESNIATSISNTKRLRTTNFIITAGLVLVVCLIPDALYTKIFGRDFTGIQQLIWWLAPGILAFSYYTITTHFFAGIGKSHYNTIISFTGFALTIVAGLLLIPSYGITGAAITASVVYIVNTLQAAWMFGGVKPV